MGKVLLREVRASIEQTLITSEDLETFLLGYFPKVFNELDPRMTKAAKITELLKRHQDDLAPIVAALEDFEKKESVPAPPKAAAGDVAEHLSVRQLVYMTNVKEALDLDRFDQWGELHGLLKNKRHEAILLLGARHQGLDYFIMRMMFALDGGETHDLQSDRLPARRLVEVHWHPNEVDELHACPSIRNDYIAALAEALDCKADKAELGRKLSRWLKHRSLLVVHPPIHEGYESDALRWYYREFLPDLLRGVEGAFSCKFLQPIGWRGVPIWKWLLAHSLKWMYSKSPQWLLRSLQRWRAHRLTEDLLDRASPPLSVSLLSELKDVTDEHLLAFCRRIELPREKHDEFIKLIKDGSRNYNDLIHAIALWLPRYRKPEGRTSHDFAESA